MLKPLYQYYEPESKWQLPNWKIFLPAVIAFTFFFCIFFSSCGNMQPARASEVIDLSIIAKIESSGNPFAYNRYSQARGLCQITPICFKEYVQFHPKDKYKNHPNFLFDANYNLKIADWYMNNRIPFMLKFFKIEDTLENRLWAYNAGIGRLIKRFKPLETQQYIKRYKQLARSGK